MIVRLPGEMTLNNIAEIRNELLPALHARESIELDAQAVTEVDVAGLQLLCSLHRAAYKQKTALTILGGSWGGPIQEAEQRAGFARHIGCTPGCLWKDQNRE